MSLSMCIDAFMLFREGPPLELLHGFFPVYAD
jgi:hypothetical protein